MAHNHIQLPLAERQAECMTLVLQHMDIFPWFYLTDEVSITFNGMPIYEHDCDSCEWVCNLKKNRKLVDVYHHNGSFILREADEASENCSYPWSVHRFWPLEVQLLYTYYETKKL